MQPVALVKILMGRHYKITEKLVRTLREATAICLLFSNAVFSYQNEKTFWEERRLASLGRPSPFQITPPTFRSLENLPKLTRFNLPYAPELNRALEAIGPTLGTLRRIKTSNSPEPAKVIIHIQDVHLNQEAQGNIGKTIEKLIENHQVDLVALEGAFGPLDFTAFRRFPNKTIVRQTADYLLQENKISGAVHAAFSSGEDAPLFTGVDSEEHYHANVEALVKSTAQKEFFKKRLTDLEITLAKKKALIFSLPLAAFDQEIQAYRAGHLSFGKYVRILVRQSSHTPPNAKNFIDALQLESSLDFAQVEKERSRILSQLLLKLKLEERKALVEETLFLRTGNLGNPEFYTFFQNLLTRHGIQLASFPAMNSYLRYLHLSERLDPEIMLQETARMEKDGYGSLAKTKEERALVDEGRGLYLTGKLVAFSLTPDEWEEYEKTVPSSWFIVPGENSFDSRNQELRTRNAFPLSSFESFYREAEARDQSMTENLLRIMADHHASTVILVTGGFHTRGINSRLERAGMTTISFTPKITNIHSEMGTLYLNAFMQEKTPLEKLFEGQKLYLTPKVYSLATDFLARIVAAAFTAAAYGPAQAKTAMTYFLSGTKTRLAAFLSTGSSLFPIIYRPKTGSLLFLRVNFKGQAIDRISQWKFQNPFFQLAIEPIEALKVSGQGGSPLGKIREFERIFSVGSIGLLWLPLLRFLKRSGMHHEKAFRATIVIAGMAEGSLTFYWCLHFVWTAEAIRAAGLFIIGLHLVFGFFMRNPATGRWEVFYLWRMHGPPFWRKLSAFSSAALFASSSLLAYFPCVFLDKPFFAWLTAVGIHTIGNYFVAISWKGQHNSKKARGVVLRGAVILSYLLTNLNQSLRPPPKMVEIEITNFCNLRCAVCRRGNPDYRREPVTHMSFSEFKAIIDAYDYPLEKIQFCGTSEPAANPALPEMVRYVVEKKKPKVVELITNGTLLTPKLSRELIATGLTSLKVSIDGPDELTYQAIRRHALKPVKNNLKAFGDLIKGKNLSFGVNCVIAKPNARSLKKMPQFVSDIGADTLELRIFETNLENLRELSIHDEKLVDQIRGEVEEESKRLKIKFVFFKELDGDEKASCKLMEEAHINYEGRLTWCYHLPHSAIGVNLAKGRFSSTWNGKEIRKLLQDVADGSFRPECCCLLAIRSEVKPPALIHLPANSFKLDNLTPNSGSTGTIGLLWVPVLRLLEWRGIEQAKAFRLTTVIAGFAEGSLTFWWCIHFNWNAEAILAAGIILFGLHLVFGFFRRNPLTDQWELAYLWSSRGPPFRVKLWPFFSAVLRASSSLLAYFPSLWGYHPAFLLLFAVTPHLLGNLLSTFAHPSPSVTKVTVPNLEGKEAEKISITKGPRKKLADGLNVEEISMEGTGLRSNGEVYTINPNNFIPVQRVSEDVRTRDIIDAPLQLNDPRVGHTIQEYVEEENHIRDEISPGITPNSKAVVLALNSTQSDGWLANSATIINGKLIIREPGKRGLGQKAYEPPHGIFWFISLDRDNPGVFKVEIDHGKLVRELPFKNGFAGPLLIFDGPDSPRRTMELKDTDNPDLKLKFGIKNGVAGNDLDWDSQDKRQAYTVYGYNAKSELVIVQLMGDPNDPERKEPAIRHVIPVLMKLGIKCAILGGTSADVQRYSKYDLPTVKWAKSWATPPGYRKLNDYLGNKEGQRRLGQALMFYHSPKGYSRGEKPKVTAVEKTIRQTLDSIDPSVHVESAFDPLSFEFIEANLCVVPIGDAMGEKEVTELVVSSINEQKITSGPGVRRDTVFVISNQNPWQNLIQTLMGGYKHVYIQKDRPAEPDSGKEVFVTPQKISLANLEELLEIEGWLDQSTSVAIKLSDLEGDYSNLNEGSRLLNALIETTEGIFPLIQLVPGDKMKRMVESSA